MATIHATTPTRGYLVELSDEEVHSLAGRCGTVIRTANGAQITTYRTNDRQHATSQIVVRTVADTTHTNNLRALPVLDPTTIADIDADTE